MNDIDNPCLSPDLNAGPPVVVAEVVEEPKRPWGFWMTMLFSFVVMAVFFAIQTGVAVVTMIVAAGLGEFKFDGNPASMQQFLGAGWFLALATWVCLPCTLGTIYFFIRLRRRWSFTEYVGWDRVAWPQWCLWLAVILVAAVANDVCCWLLKVPIVTEFQRQACATSYWPPLLWATLLVAAPLFEEFFFRGFMFRGIQASPLGNIGAVLLTSLVWAAIHLQYDIYQIGVIFLGGCLLGTARARTGSCRITMGMHFLMNLIATAEVYVLG
jgi:uncharacterized protein